MSVWETETHVKNEPDDSMILPQMSGQETATCVKGEQNDSIIQPQLSGQETHHLVCVKNELGDTNQTHMSGQETGSGLEYVKSEPDIASVNAHGDSFRRESLQV